jgi:hypothetical protein
MSFWQISAGLVFLIIWAMRETKLIKLEIAISRNGSYNHEINITQEKPTPSPNNYSMANGWRTTIRIPGGDGQCILCYERERVRLSPWRWIPLIKWGSSSINRKLVVFLDNEYDATITSTMEAKLSVIGLSAASLYEEWLMETDNRAISEYTKNRYGVSLTH